MNLEAFIGHDLHLTVPGCIPRFSVEKFIGHYLQFGLSPNQIGDMLVQDSYYSPPDVDLSFTIPAGQEIVNSIRRVEAQYLQAFTLPDLRFITWSRTWTLIPTAYGHRACLYVATIALPDTKLYV